MEQKLPVNIVISYYGFNMWFEEPLCLHAIITIHRPFHGEIAGASLMAATWLYIYRKKPLFLARHDVLAVASTFTMFDGY